MSGYNVAPLEKLIDNLNKISCIGKKTAKRMAYSVLKMTDLQVEEFVKSIIDAKKNIKYCSVCCNFTDETICAICKNKKRDKSVICVVESPKDVEILEKMRKHNFIYHVLHGLISPINGVNMDKIYIKELINRVSNEKETTEIILALNPTVEGEATSVYISKLLRPLNVKVTRLAYGIPVGASLEYTDEVTLLRAIQGRSEV